MYIHHTYTSKHLYKHPIYTLLTPYIHHDRYYNNSSNDFGESQTANALGLLAAPTIAPGAVARLVANIKGRSTHISTGAVGSRWILQVIFFKKIS